MHTSGHFDKRPKHMWWRHFMGSGKTTHRTRITHTRYPCRDTLTSVQNSSGWGIASTQAKLRIHDTHASALFVLCTYRSWLILQILAHITAYEIGVFCKNRLRWGTLLTSIKPNLPQQPHSTRHLKHGCTCRTHKVRFGCVIVRSFQVLAAERENLHGSVKVRMVLNVCLNK